MGPRDEPRAPLLVFVVNVDWFFLSHRLPLAIAAGRAGFRVVVAAADTGQAEAIRRHGLEFVPFPLSRGSANPIRDVATLAFLIGLYARLRPQLVHHVTIKPVLYGSLAARLVGGIAVVNAVSGLGYTFISHSTHARALRPVVKALYRAALGQARSRTIFQNADDRDAFVAQGLLEPEQTVLIRGSGVNCTQFQPSPEPEGPPVVMLASRMLWDKGVGQFVTAARLLRARGREARFVLVGPLDPANPSAVRVSEIDGWVRDGVVEWWGQRDDMPGILAGAHILVLPSRREGLPKILLEAAACGRPIVATDVPGCREIVHGGVNGLLVPLDDPRALADAIDRLLQSPDLRARFGQAGRKMALAQFAEEIVVGETLSLYHSLLR